MTKLVKLSERIRRKLGDRKVIFVECSTAGFVSWVFAKKPGASRNFWGGFALYSNELKGGFGADLSDGAVSERCVTSLAKEIYRRYKPDFVVVESSVLGPSAGTRPKGMSWVAVFCAEEGKVFTWVDIFSGTRESIRYQVALRTLELFYLHLEGKKFPTYEVASSFLEYDGKILVLKRSRKVRTYKGYWGVASGYVEENETPPETALKEIREETGITEIAELKRATYLEVVDPKIGVRWIVHPFRAVLKTRPKVKLDWEHTTARWIKPENLRKLKTSPLLWVGYLKTVWGEVEDIRV